MSTNRARAARAAERTFEQLYRGYRDDVYRAALRDLGNVHDAEDVTQAAFVDAYRAVLRGAEPRSPRAWMLAISENVRRRRLRTAQRRPREEAVEDADFPLAAELPHEQARALAGALAKLPVEQRRVFALREIVGLSYDEIAGELGSTVGSVQMQLHRARRSLREELDPPVVSRRTRGVFVPLPGWRTGLLSRVEAVVLTPRAAGALGAAAVAVAGVSVSVGEAPADGRPPAASEPRLRSASTRTAARAVARENVSSTPVAARVAPAARAARRGAASKPQVAAPPAPAPTGGGLESTTPAPQPAPPLAAGVPALERPPFSVPVPPATPLPVPPLPVPPLPVPQPDDAIPGSLAPPVPPATASIVELATGAVEAAGADAPPLPAPSLPPGTLPPAP